MASEQCDTSLRDMTLLDVAEVTCIEQQVHSHPWTAGNFRDSLASGHICKVFERASELVGYAVLMPVLEEVQLLLIGIAGPQQRKGLGKKLLQELLALAHALKFARVILEVSVANHAAHALYAKVGFNKIGLRRGYYPGTHGGEDAVIMEYTLA